MKTYGLVYGDIIYDSNYGGPAIATTLESITELDSWHPLPLSKAFALGNGWKDKGYNCLLRTFPDASVELYFSQSSCTGVVIKFGKGNIYQRQMTNGFAVHEMQHIMRATLMRILQYAADHLTTNYD